MKVWYFKIIEDLVDYIHMMEVFMLDHFGETRIKLQFHQPNDHEFYFIGEEHDKNEILKILEDENLKTLIAPYEKAYKVKECTQDVLFNIQNYKNIKNEITDENVLYNFYLNTRSKDVLLDKINLKGLDFLTPEEITFLKQ